MTISYAAEKRKTVKDLLDYAVAMGEVPVPLCAWDSYESHFANVLEQIGTAVYAAKIFDIGRKAVTKQPGKARKIHKQKAA